MDFQFGGEQSPLNIKPGAYEHFVSIGKIQKVLIGAYDTNGIEVYGYQDLQGRYVGMTWEPVTGVRRLRQERGLTLQALADAAGVHISQIQKLESGERQFDRLSARTAVAIADALGVDVHDLLGQAEAPAEDAAEE